MLSKFGPSDPNRTVQVNFKGRFTVRLFLLLGFRIYELTEIDMSRALQVSTVDKH